MRGMNILVLFLVLSLCTEEISAGWFRRVVDTVKCAWKCGTRCVGIPPKCSFTCFKDCGRKKRSKGEGKLVPLPVDYDSYICDDNEEITLACFKAVLNQPNNVHVETGFNIADEDGDGKISRTEFAAAPWFLEGEEDDAPSDIRNAANNLRKGSGNGGREGQENGGRTGQGNGGHLCRSWSNCTN